MIIIKTNNIPRPIIYGYELSSKERLVYGYLDDEELECSPFFRYKGCTYSLGDFMPINDNGELKDWHACMPDGFFSGVVIKLSDCGECVTIGTYYS
jgi:hypothetical protein